MEKEVYAKMLKCIGFTNGEAIFAPGRKASGLSVLSYHVLILLAQTLQGHV